jgi:hypothetical protein
MLSLTHLHESAQVGYVPDGCPTDAYPAVGWAGDSPAQEQSLTFLGGGIPLDDTHVGRRPRFELLVVGCKLRLGCAVASRRQLTAMSRPEQAFNAKDAEVNAEERRGGIALRP